MKKNVRSMSRLAKMIAALVLFSTAAVFAQTRQEHIHQMAHGVMPFDMSKTVHIFKMTESGGSDASR